MLDRLRDLLRRIRKEPVLLALVVSVAAALGLDDVAAQAGVELTQETVAGVIGAVLLVTRKATNSRRHTKAVESERDKLERTIDENMDAETVLEADR